MDVSEFLQNFVADTWYKALMLFGAIVQGILFFAEAKGITNHQLQLLAGGGFLIGLGEWKNHKVVSHIKPPNAHTGGAAMISQTMPDLIGRLLDLLGVVMLVIGMVRIFRG
jgi:hypothetical protein